MIGVLHLVHGLLSQELGVFAMQTCIVLVLIMLMFLNPAERGSGPMALMLGQDHVLSVHWYVPCHQSLRDVSSRLHEFTFAVAAPAASVNFSDTACSPGVLLAFCWQRLSLNAVVVDADDAAPPGCAARQCDGCDHGGQDGPSAAESCCGPAEAM